MKNLVSIIIISRSEAEDTSGLMNDIDAQKNPFDIEAIKIVGVSPPGRARNQGAAKAKGNFLVFLDCDIRLGSEYYLVHLVEPLLKDDTIGATCASLRLPPGSSRFQQRYARQVLHCEFPILKDPMEVFVAPSACFAMSRELFARLGGFNEEIIRGEDSELSLRLTKAGYKIIQAAQTWCYHPAPDNLLQLIKMNFRNGCGVSFVDAFYPELNIDVHPRGLEHYSGRKTPGERFARFFSVLAAAVFQLKILLFLSKAFYALGYLYGSVLYRLRMQKRPKRPVHPARKILIINLGGIGDIFLSYPALKALKNLYPQAEIAALVTSHVHPIVRDMSVIDKVYDFDVRYGGVIPFGKIFNDISVLWELRRERFDIALNMRTLTSKRSAGKIGLLLSVLRPGITVGRDTERRGRFFDIKIPEADMADCYAMEYDIRTVEALGAEVKDRQIDLKVFPEAANRIEDLLVSRGILSQDVLVGVHIGGLPSRRWPVENFALVLDGLNKGFSCRFVATGGPDEAALVQKLKKLTQAQVVDLDGQLSIRELVALIKRCGLFISNDTGPMHIAAILKIPLVAIFGPGDLLRFDPRNISDKAVVLHKPQECSPCYKKECDSMVCLKAVTPQEVLDAARALLKGMEKV